MIKKTEGTQLLQVQHTCNRCHRVNISLVELSRQKHKTHFRLEITRKYFICTDTVWIIPYESYGMTERFVYSLNQNIHAIIHFFFETNGFQPNNASREMSHKTRMCIIHHNSK